MYDIWLKSIKIIVAVTRLALGDDLLTFPLGHMIVAAPTAGIDDEGDWYFGDLSTHLSSRRDRVWKN